MTVSEFVQAQKIREIVHFTTQKGLLGTAFTRALLPRKQLREEQLLEYILKINAASRRDTKWFDFVNLSINDINRRFFAAADRWHRGIWWVVLSFSPEILEHDGVYFATTNNAYDGVVQNHSVEGLRALYAQPIDHGFASWPLHSRDGCRPEDPTCPQAEVLYPGRLSTEFLRRVYVADEATYREACSFLTFLPNVADIQVTIEPDRFTPHKVDPCQRR